MADRLAMDRAAEYLRMALPLMSRHRVPVTPPNYAVWYEHVSGANPALSAAIEERVGRGETIGEALTAELYREHVALPDEERIAEARRTLHQIAHRVNADVASAGTHVSRYGEHLDGCTQRLDAAVGADDLRLLVSDLAKETRSVRETSLELKARLDASLEEAESLRRQLEVAREEARTDPLTGLANRKAFDQAFEALVGESDADGPGHCLLLVDIDRFKRVNDSYGHLLGDKVIRFVGRTIRETVKGRDLVARFGGEEFVVLLPDTPLHGAMAVAENIRRTIEVGRLVRADTREPIGVVTVSVGAARHRPGESADDLIERADAAMYRAKQAGRNRVEPEALAPADAAKATAAI